MINGVTCAVDEPAPWNAPSPCPRCTSVPVLLTKCHPHQRGCLLPGLIPSISMPRKSWDVLHSYTFQAIHDSFIFIPTDAYIFVPHSRTLGHFPSISLPHDIMIQRTNFPQFLTIKSLLTKNVNKVICCTLNGRQLSLSSFEALRIKSLSKKIRKPVFDSLVGRHERTKISPTLVYSIVWHPQNCICAASVVPSDNFTVTPLSWFSLVAGVHCVVAVPICGTDPTPTVARACCDPLGYWRYLVSISDSLPNSVSEKIALTAGDCPMQKDLLCANLYIALCTRILPKNN